MMDDEFKEFGYCQWILTQSPDSFYWETGCGRYFEFCVSNPEEMDFRYCPYCGHEIVKQNRRIKV